MPDESWFLDMIQNHHLQHFQPFLPNQVSPSTALHTLPTLIGIAVSFLFHNMLILHLAGPYILPTPEN